MLHFCTWVSVSFFIVLAKFCLFFTMGARPYEWKGSRGDVSMGSGSKVCDFFVLREGVEL